MDAPLPLAQLLHARSTTSASTAASASTKTFTTALWLNAAVFAIEIIVFTVLRPRFSSVYEPRAVLLPEGKRSTSLGKSLFAWPIALWRADHNAIRAANGLDAYFFVRFLRMFLYIIVPIWIVSWAVLMPLTGVGSGAGLTGLDRFTFGNVGQNQQSRYAAHLILAWLFTFWTLYVLRREYVHFIHIRHAHLASPAYSATPRARTLLLTGVPAPLLNPAALRALYRDIPGGVQQVWVNRDVGKLPKEMTRRDNALKALEGAENKLLRTAAKADLKMNKQQEKAKLQKKGAPDVESGAGHRSGAEAEDLAALVPAKKRPTKRLPIGFIPFSLPLMGKKVDAIEWNRTQAAEAQANLARGRAALRAQIAREVQGGTAGAKTGGIAGLMGKVAGKVNSKTGRTTNPDAELGLQGYDPEEGRPAAGQDIDGVAASASAAGSPNAGVAEGVQEDSATYAPLGSAFVLFASARAAHMAAQLRSHHAPGRVTAGKGSTDVAPEDVIWGNLGLNPYECQIRRLISYAATAALIIFWAIPVAFVGIVSNIAGLCVTYSWLAWLCKIPGIVLGIIEGILPPVLLAVLMMLLPIILRKLARFEGMMRRTQVELSLMSRYFMFQIIHSFLIVTLASGIIAALPQLVNNPTGIPTILATQLPKASTFFLTYIILQGLSGAASSFLQAVPLVLYYAKLYLLGSTPRQIYTMKHSFRSVSWGTLFPATTLIVVITITYSIISPIINGLAVLTFVLFYFVYKYLFLYNFAQPRALDTGGLFFPSAIGHVFVGLYLQQICLAALFFLAQNAEKKQSAIPEGALMIVLIVITAVFHYTLSTMYAPLVDFLPLSLANRATDAGTAEDGEAAGAAAGVAGARGAGTGAVPSARTGPGGMGNGVGVGEKPGRASYDSSFDSSSPVAPTKPYSNTTNDGATNTNTNNHNQLDPAADGSESPHDFTHPVVHTPAPIVWIAADALGFAGGEVRECRAAGVDAASDPRWASMNEKGKVTVEEDAVPPGEEGVAGLF